MNEFKFFLKLLGMTLVIVLLTQIQIGDRSVEAHAMGAVQNSGAFAPLNGVATGATKVIRDITGKLHAAVDKNQGKRKNGEKKPSRGFNWFGKAEPDQSTEANR